MRKYFLSSSLQSCLKAMLLSLLLLPAAGAADDGKATARYHNPVLEVSLPDPDIIKAPDGYFYLYATEDTRNLPIWRTRDLVNWLFVGTAFSPATRPANLYPFQVNGVTLRPAIWAPNINYFGGRYVLYYTRGIWDHTGKVEDSNMYSAVNVATADAPEGPFVDRGVVSDAQITGICNTIDPCYVEDKGKKYLFFGANCGGIWCIRLTDDGLRTMPGTEPVQIAAKGCMEGSYIYRRNGYFYLFGSNGDCCSGERSNYHMLCARSRDILGPYITESGYRLLDCRYDTIFSGNDICAGPGHNARFVDDDNCNTWIIYHGYRRGSADKGRVLWIDRVRWEGGWPRLGDNGHPSSGGEAPYFIRNNHITSNR